MQQLRELRTRGRRRVRRARRSSRWRWRRSLRSGGLALCSRLRAATRHSGRRLTAGV